VKKKILSWGAALFLLGRFLSAQELAIDYRYNTARPDSSNYLSFRTPIYLIGVDRDSFDAATGASKQRSTGFLGAFQMDMQGKATISGGVRGLLLFAVASDSTRLEDALQVTKAAGGVITIEYVHRGVAYRISTDRNGKIGFPRGNYVMRTIGYIQGHDPQVLSRDFSSTGTALSVDWKKVWDPKAPTGREIAPGAAAKTGAIQNDFGDYTAMYHWDGTLQASFEDNILKISGSLKAVKR
jgi:hypothetical protein